MKLGIVASVLTGCGRIAFDPLGGPQAGGDAAADTAPDAFVCGGGGGVWNDGDFTTYSQTDWSDDATAVAALDFNFTTVYAANAGIGEFGVAGVAGFSMQFSSADRVETYLPASGAAAPLTADLVNPITSPAGVFGGDVVALQLDVDFADAGLMVTAIRFGDLTLCGLGNGLDGMTVRQFLAGVNGQLGGGTSAFSIATTAPVAAQLASAFPRGMACMFAAQHLVAGTCP